MFLGIVGYCGNSDVCFIVVRLGVEWLWLESIILRLGGKLRLMLGFSGLIVNLCLG